MKIRSFEVGRATSIHLAYFDENREFEHHMLSAGQSKQLERITSPARRREFVFTRALLSNIAQGEDIVYLENGAPILQSEKYHISISHSSLAVAIMISDFECGIDIELLNRNFKRVAKKYITPSDAPAQSDYELAAVWAAKEAIYKLHQGAINIFEDAKIIRIDKNKINCMVLDREIDANIFEYREHIVSYCKVKK
ncbi:MAG: 4'-phosphopantetheinyl transferase superfamily protein [Rikenellaceae bacterium]